MKRCCRRREEIGGVSRSRRKKQEVLALLGYSSFLCPDKKTNPDYETRNPRTTSPPPSAPCLDSGHYHRRLLPQRPRAVRPPPVRMSFARRLLAHRQKRADELRGTGTLGRGFSRRLFFVCSALHRFPAHAPAESPHLVAEKRGAVAGRAGRYLRPPRTDGERAVRPGYVGFGLSRINGARADREFYRRRGGAYPFGQRVPRGRPLYPALEPVCTDGDRAGGAQPRCRGDAGAGLGVYDCQRVGLAHGAVGADDYVLCRQ